MTVFPLPPIRRWRARYARRCLARRWDGMRCERHPNGHDGPHAANMTFRSPSTEIADPAWWVWTDSVAVQSLRASSEDKAVAECQREGCNTRFPVRSTVAGYCTAHEPF